MIAAFHASWANFDPLWGHFPSARLLQLGSGAFAKGAECLYVTRAVAHARDVRICTCHQLEDDDQQKRRSATAAGVISPVVARPQNQTVFFHRNALANSSVVRGAHIPLQRKEWGDGGALLCCLTAYVFATNTSNMTPSRSKAFETRTRLSGSTDMRC